MHRFRIRPTTVAGALRALNRAREDLAHIIKVQGQKSARERTRQEAARVREQAAIAAAEQALRVSGKLAELLD